VVAFELDSRIGIVFGNVLPGPYNRSTGFIPGYVIKASILARSIREKHLVESISACMGVRRSLWEKLGGFDEILGAGTPFKAGEETDFTIRALLAGYFVYETPHVTVIHHGFRTWEQGLTLIHGYWQGTGAMFAKHIKCGYWTITPLLLRLAWRWVFGHSRIIEGIGSRRHRWLRLIAFVQGFMAGAITPVDKTKCHYVHQKK
jgi:GT2 family glycosyltransferase